MRPDDRLQFRPGSALLASLELRARQHGLSSPDIQAKTDLGTLQALLDAELRRIPLTVAEALFLADLVDGRQPVAGAPMLYAECRHALGDPRMGTGRQPQGALNPEALLARLERLGPAADFALCEALAGWRASQLDPTAEGLTQAGLRVTNAAASHPGETAAGETAA